MRLTILTAWFSCVLMTGCVSGVQGENAGISTRRESTKISFGIYDIAKSPSISDLFAPPEPLYQKGISASTTETASAQPQSKDVVDAATIRQTSIGDRDAGFERKVIKNAEIHLEANDPDTLQKVIVGVAEANGGFVLSTEQSMSDVTRNVRDSITVTIRVPADRFTLAVETIRASADRFLVEALKGDDVTEEFIDVQARLRAKKALEEQFIQILKQAETVEDALSVQSRLAEVRGEIEKIEGRLRFLENQSAYSTIKVHIQTPSTIAANSAGFFGRLGDSAGRGFDAASNFTLGLVTFAIGALPVVLFLGIPIFLIGRSLWPRNTNTMSVTEIAKEEIENE